MDKTTKIKEAFKFALAFALVYGIALKVNWLSPGWAGWSVVAIAATSGGGESLQKGFLRIWGTLLASLIGIAIISLGAQDRWLFMFLTAGWLFFCTYKMLADKKRSYFWFVAGYVTLVITAAGPSSAGGFYIAVFRTMETIMGIVVYTLIAVFIWHRTNIGSIKKAANDLLDTQTKLMKNVYGMFQGTDNKEQLRELGRLQVKQLGQFSQSLKAEGSESYYVKEQKPLWDRFESLNNRLLKSFDRLFEGMEDLSNTGSIMDRPDLKNFFEELNSRFIEVSNLISGHPPSIAMQDVKLTVISFARKDISQFDKAALAIIISELNNIEAISRDMLNVAINLSDDTRTDSKAANRDSKNQKKSVFKLPVFDIEYLKGSFYVSSVIILGFIIWFYVNPPGHASWYIMGGVFALIFAGAQQVKTVKLIIPFILAMVAASLIYVFVLPGFTNFYQLGILLFACMFVIQYFLPGPAAAIFTIAVIQLIAINNPQTFNDSGLVNSFVFISLLMVYLYGMSYLINSPRPEKELLSLVSRFFKSTRYLLSHQTVDAKSSSMLQRYKVDFYNYEMRSLPAKIKAWGKAIDKSLFPATDYQQIEDMVNSIEVMVVRMETLFEAKSLSQDNQLIELSATISDWKERLIRTFDSWDDLPEEEIESNATELVFKKMQELEERLKIIVAENENEINEEEGIQFYRLLGGYRGVTEAILSFARVADKIDWKQWKEERFQ